MIGPDYRRPGAHSPEIEHALPYTVAGQADFANPALGRRCGDCVWFQITLKKTRALGRCGLYARRMRGRQGAKLSNAQYACRQFREANS
jgi:hypothetical protein